MGLVGLGVNRALLPPGTSAPGSPAGSCPCPLSGPGQVQPEPLPQRGEGGSCAGGQHSWSCGGTAGWGGLRAQVAASSLRWPGGLRLRASPALPPGALKPGSARRLPAPPAQPGRLSPALRQPRGSGEHVWPSSGRPRPASRAEPR